VACVVSSTLAGSLAVNAEVKLDHPVCSSPK